MTEVLGAELSRAIDNAVHFVNPKSLWLPGELLFEISENYVSVTSCSDYFAAYDAAKLSSESTPSRFVLSLEDAKNLSTLAKERKAKQYTVSLEVSDGKLLAESTEGAKDFEFGITREENWDVVETLLFGTDYEVVSNLITERYFHPDRWSKISQLKPKDAPLGFTPVNIYGNFLLRIRLGPTFHGAVKSLDTDKIPEELKFDWMT